ncbi:MAG TPA: tripartite tricarboxylate transporter substrate binding protein [Casimicrobiaceae bacterium]|nr:tripartite tricarboxylate transporter substrate binding protein [Casimicrobiaceae bacterium]
MYRSIARFAFALLVAIAITGGAHAQSWPTKPVRVIVPFTAGSATDILARTFGQKLQELWGQSVVVENRPGAGGTIGAGVVAHSAPDGYILLVHSAGYAVNPWIYPGLPYDTAKDFTEIAPLGGQPNVLVVAPESGIRSVADLIARAKEKPGALNYGSAGSGSGTHINGEKFKLATGIDVVHVPYKGTPEALNDTMAGRVTYFFSPISAALPQVKAGKLVALAVSSAQRSSQLKDVPTLAESGLPGFDYNLWVALFGPAGMPAELVDHINRDVQRALQAPEVRDRLANLGAEPMPMTTADFKTFVKSELEVNRKIVQAAGIKAQ